MSKPKLLLVYPHNPFEGFTGINVRIKELLLVASQSYQIHLLGERYFESSWENYPIKNDLVTELFLHDFQGDESVYGKLKKKIKDSLLNLRLLKTKNPEDPAKSKNSLKGKYIGKFYDYAAQSTFEIVDNIALKHSYEVIIVAYPFWGNIIKHSLFKNSKKIILIEDFQTAQLIARHEKVKNLGNMFKDELAIITQFNEAICISNQERWMFSMFIPQTRFYYIPFFQSNRFLPIKTSYDFDLLFLGSNNPFNIEAINWFIKYVWPLLPKSSTLLVAGKVSKYISPRSGITFIDHVDDTFSCHNSAKLVICPMQSGTGMKIKMIEALSFGKPIVCTLRALDGFMDYHNNGCIIADDPIEFSNSIINILSSDQLYEDLANQAKQYFLSSFDKEKVGREFLSILLNKL